MGAWHAAFALALGWRLAGGFTGGFTLLPPPPLHLRDRVHGAVAGLADDRVAVVAVAVEAILDWSRLE